MTHRILVSDAKTTDPDAIRGVLTDIDASVTATVAHDESALREAAVDADALIVDANTPVTASVLRELDDLVVVGRAGIGVDNVAIETAEATDVTVVNVPEYCVEEVSTHAVGLLLACLRRLGQYDRSVTAGKWDWTVGRPISRLAGSPVGLVAFGRIGRRTAEKLAGFDVELLAYDPYVPDDEMREAGVTPVDFELLLERSDAVSIHAPLTDETRGMFDADAFDRMRENSILLNTARGPIVREEALLEALESGEIDAAGLDVREREPPGDSPLHDRDDVVLSPHAAWYSEASRTELSESVARDVERVLSGNPPRHPVDSANAWD